MDSQKLELYTHPLQFSSPNTVKKERNRQLIIALICIGLGAIFNLMWAVCARLHIPFSPNNDRVVIFYAVITMGIAPYGVYRLLRLRHFTEIGLRNQLIYSDESVHQYHTELMQKQTKRKVAIRQSKWYNQAVISDRQLMVVIVGLFAIALIGIVVLTIIAVATKS